eukprot:3283546-Pyramimonas_sp.AAC.1
MVRTEFLERNIVSHAWRSLASEGRKGRPGLRLPRPGGIGSHKPAAQGAPRPTVILTSRRMFRRGRRRQG